MDITNKGFRELLEEAIGAENASVAFSALDEQASVSVRVNPFKRNPGFADASPVPWCEDGFILEGRPVFTLDPFFHAGCYYVQDSSSMFVGHVSGVIAGEHLAGMDDIVRVLDLCAAPGGKTTHLAAVLRKIFGDRFVLVANEVMKGRVSVLSDNVAVWGDPNVVVTSNDPSDFAALHNFFDLIVADVPCSGEGMFRKDAGAVSQWSTDNVSLCAARQKRIVADVWPALSPGGFLVYSTCTFNRRENDDNVEWIASSLGAEPLFEGGEAPFPEIIRTRLGFSLVPGFVKGEGQYCSALRKNGDLSREPLRQSRTRRQPEDAGRFFNVPVRSFMKGDMLKAVPLSIAETVAFLEDRLDAVASGCAVGRMKGRDLVPDADLALSIALSGDAFRKVEVDRKTALSFLHRDSLVLEGAEQGCLLLCHEGVPLGFVKNLGRRCNNLHPQGRRIRMDIDKQF